MQMFKDSLGPVSFPNAQYLNENDRKCCTYIVSKKIGL